MTKEQIKANFKVAHEAAAVKEVAAAQYLQFEAAANLASARAKQRGIERQFKEDMAAPDTTAQMELPLTAGKK